VREEGRRGKKGGEGPSEQIIPAAASSSVYYCENKGGRERGEREVFFRRGGPPPVRLLFPFSRRWKMKVEKGDRARRWWRVCRFISLLLY